MNHEILRLLIEAGANGDVEWCDVVMLYNYAPVPPPYARASIPAWNRGFNLTVLSHGQPAFFAKCRPAGEPILQRATAIRSCLASDQSAGLAVPAARVASSERISVQVSRFLRGPHYGHVVRRQPTRTYVESLRSVLAGNATLSRRAQRECLGAWSSSATIGVAESASASLADVAALAMLDSGERKALDTAVMNAGEVPSRPQHGDFWWQNLLVADGRVWVIDFDSYGEVRVPLFDDVTLILGTLGLRAGGAVAGLARLVSGEAEGRECRGLLAERADAEGLTASQVDGTLIYFLAHMASSVHRRGGSRFGAPHVAALRFAAQRLADGKRLLSPW